MVRPVALISIGKAPGPWSGEMFSPNAPIEQKKQAKKINRLAHRGGPKVTACRSACKVKTRLSLEAPEESSNERIPASPRLEPQCAGCDLLVQTANGHCRPSPKPRIRMALAR